MTILNTAKEVIEFTEGKQFYWLKINGTECESWYERDDGAVVCSSGFATIAEFPPFDIDYMLANADL